jgi:hypothetical protein
VEARRPPQGRVPFSGTIDGQQYVNVNTAKTPKGVTVPTGTEWQCVELVNCLYVTKG